MACASTGLPVGADMDADIRKRPLDELRRRWAGAWGRQPHARIGRLLLEKSLAYRLREQKGEGLSAQQMARLDHLVVSYLRNPKSFDQGPASLKPGTKLIRSHGGAQHVVIVRPDGFEYQGKVYTSLSEIASSITGTRWNGWKFFGLKHKEKP